MDVILNGETRLYYIVGDPIAQVKSPPALTAILVERGANALVVPAHVAPADLDAFLAAARVTRNVDGIVVTVPHKIACLAFCDETTERAAFAGSTNVIRRGADGRWRGDNTDGQGYLDGMAARGFDVAGKTALLVGAGGAGSAIAYEILARGAKHLKIHDIDTTRRDRILARLAERFPGRAASGDADPTGVDLVANATPLGMREGDPLPVDATKLVAAQFVADVITRPEISPLLVHARHIGCATMPGAGMFDAQAQLLVDRMLGLDAV
ncbi:shikimate dehydrogenase [Amaricoccus sp.]|uniref:shikimate dehydrogenase family protein n=1 Tax=Amaricoccus sp. TaxID=1872485 RepID=UPI001B605113|nr:shikimate dehydrogenase [Amaricoccus sp.]MBP7001519.1 shikimate dehydrogenase [Amaricoccus sp.]